MWQRYGIGTTCDLLLLGLWRRWNSSGNHCGRVRQQTGRERGLLLLLLLLLRLLQLLAKRRLRCIHDLTEVADGRTGRVRCHGGGRRLASTTARPA